MDELPEILRSHYEDPYHRGQCERSTHAAQAHDPDTQHFILIQMRVSDEGVVEEAWFESQGCIYCEGPASIVAMHCEEKRIDELMNFDVPAYKSLTQLDQLEDPPSCHSLAWEALHNAIRATDADNEGEHPKFGGPSLGEES